MALDDATNREDDMTILTRRTMLAGAATASAAVATGWWSAARAAAPAAGKQAASFYRYKVGTIEITVVSDGIAKIPVTDALVLNAKPEEVNAALREVFMEPGVFVYPYNPIVINTGTRLAVVDMGTGEAAFAASKGLSGQLEANLAAAGIDRNVVDTVIISHYHGDHINGLLRADNSLAFPNAEILVPAPEHKYWMDDGEMARSPTQRIADLHKNARRVMNAEVRKRLRTYEWDKEVMPGVLAVGTPGHSPGHTSHIVTSGSATVYVQADVTHAPFLFARHPGWHAFYDHEPIQAEATRRKVYDMLAAEKMMVQGFHYPFPSVAHVEKTASGYLEVPMPWNPVL
jgi:glyoxylase-like metal-dependent hydrolase (beta-lactamase superfamily II)